MRTSIAGGRRGQGGYGALALALLTACAHTPSTAHAPASEIERKPPTVARPSSSVHTHPSVNQQPGATEHAAESSSDAQLPSPFFVHGELPGTVNIYPVGDRAFLANEQRLPFQLVGDEVVHDPTLERGVRPDAEYPDLYLVTNIAGRWPDATWIATVHPAGRTGLSRLRRWNGKAWAGSTETRDGETVFGIEPWSGGRLLALVQAGMMFEASFRVVSGDRNVTLPVPSKPKVTGGFCYTRIRVEAFAALPSGHVFIVGPLCHDDGTVSGLGFERWAPGQKQGTLETLPTDEFDVGAMVALGPESILLSPRQSDVSEHSELNYLLAWDGTRWNKQPTFDPSGIARFWKGANGELFASGNTGTLWSKTPDAAWTKVPLPQRLGDSAARTHVRSLWSPATGDTWVIATPGPDNPNDPVNSRSFLLHTRPAKGPLPSPEEMQHKEQELRLPGPPTAACETPFVLLYTLGKKAPPNYDYPATRAALKGTSDLQDKATFIEFEREGRRYFGAKVPDFDIGTRLSKLVSEKVPGSTPQLVCHDPLVTRTLAIDLKSGELMTGTP